MKVTWEAVLWLVCTSKQAATIPLANSKEKSRLVSYLGLSYCTIRKHMTSLLRANLIHVIGRNANAFGKAKNKAYLYSVKKLWRGRYTSKPGGDGQARSKKPPIGLWMRREQGFAEGLEPCPEGVRGSKRGSASEIPSLRTFTKTKIRFRLFCGVSWIRKVNADLIVFLLRGFYFEPLYIF